MEPYPTNSSMTCFYSLNIVFLVFMETCQCCIVFPQRPVLPLIDFTVLGIAVVSSFCSTNDAAVNILSVSPGAHIKVFL